MATTAKQMIDRLTRQHRKWIKETAQNVFDRSSSWLETDLAEGSLHSIRNISDSLHGLATYYGIKGVVDLIDGVTSGWPNVHRSCHYHLWSLTLDHLAFRRLADSTTLTLAAQKAACSLCYAIVCDLDQWSHSQTMLLSEMASGSGVADATYWRERRFEPFVLRLRQILEKTRHQVLDEGEEFGVYTGVFTHWNNDASLGEALVRICDYHCENMDDDGGDWKPEFGEAPFDLIPWELLAISKVRKLAGLSTPSISHPLANLAVTQLDCCSQAQDEILARIEAFYRQL
jgi:hypothetical protein